MAVDQDDISNQIHNSTVRSLSRLKRCLKNMLPSALKKTAKKPQLPSSNRTSSESSHRTSSPGLHGASGESNIYYPRGHNDSVYPVNDLVKTGSRKQKLLPNTHEGLLSSATQHQTLYCQPEISPSLHEGSDKLAMGRTMTSLGPGDIVRSSKMSDLSKGGLNSSKVTVARGIGRSGQYLPAGSTKVTPRNSSTQNLCQDSQPGSYATSKPSVTSAPQPRLDHNFPGRSSQPGGGLKTKIPTVCPSSRAIILRHV
jgi:hypothetical protein